jgi:O-succinylbenzoic acid--CoA ligase
MDKSSRRELLHVGSEWSIPQKIEALFAALSHDGPALAFGQSSFHEVPAECAVVVPTSGSTGTPKSVALTSTALISSARASHSYLNAQLGDRWSLLLPTTHIAGVNVLVRSIELGTKIVDSNAETDFTAIVPTQLHRALHGDSEMLQHLLTAKAVLVGGAATSPELLEEANTAGINVVTTYGMSEMSGGCVYNGTPLAGVHVNISEGVIELEGPMKAIGYLGEEPFGKKSFRTSDFGELVNGRLNVIGRVDDQIVSGGEKISLDAITQFLNAGGVQEFMAVGLPDAEWGQALAIASDGPIDEEIVRASLTNRFGPHVSPKRYLSHTVLPHTSIGKPDRKKLTEIFGRLS